MVYGAGRRLALCTVETRWLFGPEKSGAYPPSLRPVPERQGNPRQERQTRVHRKHCGFERDRVERTPNEAEPANAGSRLRLQATVEPTNLGTDLANYDEGRTSFAAWGYPFKEEVVNTTG